MKKSYLLLTSVLLACSTFAQWSPNPSTVTTPAIPIATESGNNAVQARELLVQGPLEGKTVTGEILLYFDPGTRGFLWRFSPAVVIKRDEGKVFPPSRPWLADILAKGNWGVLFAAHDGIFLFEGCPGEIRVTRESGKASSLDDAQAQALKLLSAHTASVHGLGIARPEWASISFRPLLRVVPGSLYDPKIQSVSRQKEKWEIVIQVYNKVVGLEVDPSWKITNATVLSTLPNK
jgi:hypothetical protein